MSIGSPPLLFFVLWGGVVLVVEDDWSAKQMYYMLQIYRFLRHPENKGGFSSVYSLAQKFENSFNPSGFVKLLLGDMLKFGLLRVVVGVDGRNRVVLNRDAFEEWFECTKFGLVVIGYVDDISDVRIKL